MSQLFLLWRECDEWPSFLRANALAFINSFCQLFQPFSKVLSKLLHFGIDYRAAVGLLRVEFVIILMGALARVEIGERGDFGDDGI